MSAAAQANSTFSASLFVEVGRLPLTGSMGARTPTRIMSLVALTDHDCIGIAISGCKPGVVDAVNDAAAACRSVVLPVTFVLWFHSGPRLGPASAQNVIHAPLRHQLTGRR